MRTASLEANTTKRRLSEMAQHPLIELNEKLEEIEPNRLERIGWLVDRLYAELNETDVEVT